MSYSFSAAGPTKTEAILDAEAKFAKVVSDMPVHERDQELVLSHMRNLVNLAREPGEGDSVVISLSGYMSTQDGVVHNASASCAVYVNKVA